jgi:aminoglycoside 6'-N-acetyltransferase I
MTIRTVRDGADAQAWAALRHRLWPHASATGLLDEAKAFSSSGQIPTVACVFLAEEAPEIVGFIELAIRPFADGCESRPVPYVEGWFVEPHARRRGVGRALMARAEAWARELGFNELASDTEIDNEVSLRAHASCGFVETERLVNLRKPLRGHGVA